MPVGDIIFQGLSVDQIVLDRSVTTGRKVQSYSVFYVSSQGMLTSTEM